MTVPKVETVTSGGYRWYVHPDDKRKAIGVTSALKVLSKPALSPWYAKMAAEFAVDNLSVIKQLADEGKRQVAVDMIKRAPNRRTGDAADVGTSAHGACEEILAAMLAGRPLDEIEDEQPKTGPKAQFVRQFIAFLREFDAVPEYVEATVWSDTYGYAGSFDNGLRLQLFDGKLLLVDVKTGASGIWPETALQLTAYRYAEKIIFPDGTEQPMPAVDGAAALWLRPEGYALHPVATGHDEWVAFRGLLDAFRWQDQYSHKAVRPAVNARPIKREKWGK